VFDDIKKAVGGLIPGLSGKDKKDFTLVIDKEEFPVVSGKVFRSIDNCADGCSATIVLTDKAKEKIIPFDYADAQVYLGGELVITGVVYSVEAEITSEEKFLTIGVFSPACDIIDSTKYPPYEYKMISLQQLAEEIISDLGLVVNYDSDLGSHFLDRVCIDKQQTIFNFLNEISNQFGILITSNEKGEVLFTKANTDSKPVEVIENVTNVKTKYDGRQLYAVYRIVSTTPVRVKKTEKLKKRVKKKRKIGSKLVDNYKTVQLTKIAEAYDDAIVPITRQTTIRADNVNIDEVGKTAEWERSKRWAEALTIRVPRIGWYPQGSDNLYRENTLVTLKNEDVWLGKGFDFLIKSVEYTLDDNGATCSLMLVPPQAYTGEEIPYVFGSDNGGLLKSLGL